MTPYERFVQVMKTVDEVPCQTYPDAFFADDETNSYVTRSVRTHKGEAQENIAKSLCSGCPIRLQCLEYALEAKEEYGVWGGLTVGQRNKIKRGRK